MFLPATQEEMAQLGWDALDVILVTGDAYIDSPFIGVAVIGKILVQRGFRVGIIAQPDLLSERDITRLTELPEGGIGRLARGQVGRPAITAREVTIGHRYPPRPCRTGTTVHRRGPRSTRTWS